MTIGQLAKAGGVNVETIRYYQREKIILLPKRTFGSIRRYRQQDLDHLLFIKRAQVMGFSLAEITVLLRLAKGEHCQETRDLAEKKLQVIKQKLTDLQAIEFTLENLISACQAEHNKGICPIIDHLNLPMDKSKGF